MNSDACIKKFNYLKYKFLVKNVFCDISNSKEGEFEHTSPDAGIITLNHLSYSYFTQKMFIK